MQETEQIIQRFYEATNTSSIAALAKCLKVKRQAVYSAMKNNRIPKEWYFRVAEVRDYSMDWLVHGHGRKQRFPQGMEGGSFIDDLCSSEADFAGDPRERHRWQIRLYEDLLGQREVKLDARMISNIKKFASKVNLIGEAPVLQQGL